MTPDQIDRVFGRGRLRMVTGEHVEVFREAAPPGERRRYTKRFLSTRDGDFGQWTEREWRILARLIGHGIGCVPEVVQFDRGAIGGTQIVQTYDAGATVDQWATMLPVERDGRFYRHVFEDCAHWWALAHHCLRALYAIHELQLVHLDVKGDNVCIPVGPADFDPARPGVRLYPRFEALALIDFAFSLVSRESLPTALPIGWQRDYDYQSPRLLHALEAGRQGNLQPTRDLDWRCDMYSVAAMLKRYLPDEVVVHDIAHPAGWSAERYDAAKALILAIRDAHDREGVHWRSHRQLLTVTGERLREAPLARALEQGWTLARGTSIAPLAAAPVTPITRLAPSLRRHANPSGAPVGSPLGVVAATPRVRPTPSRSGLAVPAMLAVATVVLALALFSEESARAFTDGAEAALQRVRAMAQGKPATSVREPDGETRGEPHESVPTREGPPPVVADGIAQASSDAVPAPSPVNVAANDEPHVLPSAPDAPSATVGAEAGPMPSVLPSDVAEAKTTAPTVVVPAAVPESPRSPPRARSVLAAPPAARGPAARSGLASERTASTPPARLRAAPAVRAADRMPRSAATKPTPSQARAPFALPVDPARSATPLAAPLAAPIALASTQAATTTTGLDPRGEPIAPLSRPKPPALATTPEAAGAASESAALPLRAEAGGSAPETRLAPPLPSTPRREPVPPAARQERPGVLSSLLNLARSGNHRAAPIEERSVQPAPTPGLPAQRVRPGDEPRVPPPAAAVVRPPSADAVPRPPPAEPVPRPQPADSVPSPPSATPVPRPPFPESRIASGPPLPDDPRIAQAPPREQAPRTAPPASVTLPPDHSADDDAFARRASRTLAEAVPQTAAQAQPELARVLWVAANANHPSQEQSIIDAAQRVWFRIDPPIASADRAPGSARRLHGEAQRALWSHRNVSDAFNLQLRAFGANPRDAEVAGDLAFLYLKLNPPQPAIARQVAMHAMAVNGSQGRAVRVEEWTTFAVASALTGRDADARNALFVTIALTSNLDRSCKAALGAAASFGERMRAPVEAMLYRIHAQGRGYESPYCAWPPNWAGSARNP